MALSKKNSRSITVEGEDYRWAFFENSGWNDVTIQSASGNGSKLLIQKEWEQKSGEPLPYKPVTPSFISEAILFALQNGWSPETGKSPFRIKFSNGKLRVIAG